MTNSSSKKHSPARARAHLTPALRTLVRQANREHHYPVYEVWGTLLEAMPGQIRPKEAKSYMQALVRQGIWSSFDDAPDRAIANKRGFLQKSPFSRTVASRVMQLWKKSEACGAKGVGRFTSFQRGWPNLYGSAKLTGEFLQLLRMVHDPACSRTIVVRAIRSFAARTDAPMKGTPRFSEALHLSRPQLFPIVNTQQSRVLGQLLGISQTRLLNDRRVYLGHRKHIKKLRSWLGLDGYNALDVVLIELDKDQSLLKAVQRQFTV
jgi:hypothetical protein